MGQLRIQCEADPIKSESFSVALFGGKKAADYWLRLREARSDIFGVRVFFVRVNDRLTTNPRHLGAWLSHALLSMSFFFLGTGFFLNAHGAERDPTDELQLVDQGHDCIGAIEVFNRRLTTRQMLLRVLDAHNPNVSSAIAFMNDFCDPDRVDVGIFGGRHELKRKDNGQELGRGAPYSGEGISISVTRGPLRLRIDIPGQSDCGDDYVDTLEFFDATTTVKAKNRIFNIPGTLKRPRCTKAP